MAHYVAMIEDAGPDYAAGLWFSDLPGCTSAGDDIAEALRNATKALQLYAESLQAEGRLLPHPRILTELKADPEFAEDIKAYIVALWSCRPTPMRRSDAILRNCGTGRSFH